MSTAKAPAAPSGRICEKKERKKGLSSMMAILQSFSTNLVVDQRT